jgi:hypothetical protein
MHQVNARHENIREWRSLPKELRQTDEQAAAFAMQVKDKYKFSSENADPYQTVKGWLLCYLSLTRGMEWRAEGEEMRSRNIPILLAIVACVLVATALTGWLIMTAIDYFVAGGWRWRTRSQRWNTRIGSW